jgi:hypothetical protein
LVLKTKQRYYSIYIFGILNLMTYPSRLRNNMMWQYLTNLLAPLICIFKAIRFTATFPCPDRTPAANAHFSSITFEGMATKNAADRGLERRAMEGALYPVPDAPGTKTKGTEGAGTL